jgi:hypothetical protein
MTIVPTHPDEARLAGREPRTWAREVVETPPAPEDAAPQLHLWNLRRPKAALHTHGQAGERPTTAEEGAGADDRALCACSTT